MAEQTFEEFKRSVIKSRKGCKGMVNNSFGVYDCYKTLRRHHWYNIGRPLLENEFYTIVRSMNKLMAKELANGRSVKLPAYMGKLELRKQEVGAFLKGNKLKVTYPVDWSETMKLWYEDAEAHRQKTLMRQRNPYVYHIHYCTKGLDANYNNKVFYQFSVNTFLKQALSHNIKQGKIDSLYD